MRKLLFCLIITIATNALAEDKSLFWEEDNILLNNAPLKEFEQDGQYEYASEIKDLEAKEIEEFTAEEDAALEAALDEDMMRELSFEEDYMQSLASEGIDPKDVFSAGLVNGEPTSNHAVIIDRLSVGSIDGMRFVSPHSPRLPTNIRKTCNGLNFYVKVLDNNTIIICGREILVPKKFLDRRNIREVLPVPELYFFMRKNMAQWIYIRAMAASDPLNLTRINIVNKDAREEIILEDIFLNYKSDY